MRINSLLLAGLPNTKPYDEEHCPDTARPWGACSSDGEEPSPTVPSELALAQLQPISSGPIQFWFLGKIYSLYIEVHRNCH